MTRAVFTYRNGALHPMPWDKGLFDNIPDGTKVYADISREKKRTREQNARMWAMLSDISEQHYHHGLKLTPDDWKDVFTAALRETRVVPNLENSGFVVVGGRTSKMTVSELGDLMELIEVFGAEKGVQFKEKAA